MTQNFESVSLIEAIKGIFKNSKAIINDILDIFTLEVKLAGRSIAVILASAVLILLLLLTCWLFLLGAFVAWLISLHFSVLISLLIVSGINLFIASIIVFYIARTSKNLKFKETRQQLTGITDYETITS